MYIYIYIYLLLFILLIPDIKTTISLIQPDQSDQPMFEFKAGMTSHHRYWPTDQQSLVVVL